MVATSANLRSYLVQSELSLVLHGRPEAQRRPCMQRRGNVYNPQGKQLVDTRTMIADILMCIGAIDESQKTVFDQDAKLKVQLTFFLPRPRSHLKKNATRTWILPVAMRNFSIILSQRRRLIWITFQSSCLMQWTMSSILTTRKCTSWSVQRSTTAKVSATEEWLWQYRKSMMRRTFCNLQKPHSGGEVWQDLSWNGVIKQPY